MIKGGLGQTPAPQIPATGPDYQMGLNTGIWWWPFGAASQPMNTQQMAEFCSTPYNYYTNAPCWANSMATWGQMKALPVMPPPVASKPPAGALSTSPMGPGDPTAAADAIIQQQLADQQASLDAFSATIPDNPIPAPDCTNWWTNLTDSACPGIGGLSTSTLILLAVAGGLAVILIIKEA
jgi:hypothetical protein